MFFHISQRNETNSDTFTINTGLLNENLVNIFESIDGKQQNNWYSSAKCNEINATDGFRFPISLISKTKRLETYGKDMCRKLFYDYSSEILASNECSAHWRYILNPNNFANNSFNPENSCYCGHNGPSCPPSGLFSLSTCQDGVPLYLSFPHFYGASGEGLRDFIGLEPKKELHETFLDVDPETGRVHNSVRRFQINIRLSKTTFGGYDISGD